MARGPRHTFAHRQVAVRLRAYRERAGKTQEDAATALNCNLTKIHRMETGRVGASIGDVTALATVYGLTRDEAEALISLARSAKEKGFTDPYISAVSQPLTMYAGLESAAASIDDYSIAGLSGLLQTRAYATEIISHATSVAPDSKPALIDFRIERQQILSGGAGRYRFVVHEAAIRTRVGPPGMMLDQLDHLVGLDTSTAAEIRYWPYDAGLHEWAAAPFAVLHFDDPADPDLVYLECQLDARYVEEAQQVSTYEEQFEHMFATATPIKEFRP